MINSARSKWFVVSSLLAAPFSCVCCYIIIIKSLTSLKKKKQFDDENTFKRECKAYEKASQTHELRHRVPALQGVFNRVWELFRDPHLYSRAIRLDVVQGDCLDMVIDSLSLPRRQQVHESLRTTVEILHEKAGVCHRDIRDANAMVLMDDDDEQVRLIDFSHAGFRDDMDTGLWERRKEADHIRLHGIFAGPDARSVCGLAAPCRHVSLTYLKTGHKQRIRNVNPGNRH